MKWEGEKKKCDHIFLTTVNDCFTLKIDKALMLSVNLPEIYLPILF